MHFARGKKKRWSERLPKPLKVALTGRVQARVLMLAEQSGRSVEEIIGLAVSVFELAVTDVSAMSGAGRLADRRRAGGDGLSTAPASVGAIMDRMVRKEG